MSALLPAPTASSEAQSAALREAAGAREVTDRVLRVRGPDRADWLAAMVTNDTKALAPGQSAYTAVVHVKGKILADAWVYARPDELLVVVPAETVEVLVPHFEKHVIMEDVEVTAWDEARVVSVQGPRAGALVPPDGHAVFVADRLGRGGVDCVVDGGASVPAAVARGEVITVDEPAWDLARLERGVPRFGVDFGPDNYVQEADITARAVSFHKGCYLGQEVVCRLEMRGHVRRQLVALVLDGEPPARGTAVDGLGEVTSAAFSPALGRSVALAMVKWDAARAGGDVTVAGRAARVVARPAP